VLTAVVVAVTVAVRDAAGSSAPEAGSQARAINLRVLGGWMFAQPNGKPLDPRRDQYQWKALLEEAAVREARLHDARHTAATTLLLLGVPERAVMDFMGWSNAAMVKRYAHVTARLRRDIAHRLNTFLWAANETTNETESS
jgi:integrase